MEGLRWGLSSAVNLFVKYQKLLPVSIVALVLLVNVAYITATQGTDAGLRYLGISLLAAEYTIRNGVQLAVDNSPQYTLFTLLQIISACVLLFYLVKYLTKGLEDWFSVFSLPGAIALSLIIIGLIELVVVRVLEGQFVFIPLKDGIFFLLFNLKPVLYNVHFPGWQSAIDFFVGLLNKLLSSENISDAANATANLTTNSSAETMINITVAEG